MPQLRQPDFDEISSSSQPTSGLSRMERLRLLVCSGEWGNNDGINCIYWVDDPNRPDGGYWVAWEGNDPLKQQGVTIP